ncbi:MAG: hypothetical protein FWD68_15255 [Alphaproteobacteria bacterium]|nr:hypothetical protein [Alphaproteobacteria bacterium]
MRARFLDVSHPVRRFLTNEQSPAYSSPLITISHSEAQEIVLTHDVDLNDAARIGGDLFAEAMRLKDELITAGGSEV